LLLVDQSFNAKQDVILKVDLSRVSDILEKGFQKDLNLFVILGHERLVRDHKS